MDVLLSKKSLIDVEKESADQTRINADEFTRVGVFESAGFTH